MVLKYLILTLLTSNPSSCLLQSFTISPLLWPKRMKPCCAIILDSLCPSLLGMSLNVRTTTPSLLVNIGKRFLLCFISATQPCSKTSSPTRRSQYASDEKNICFGSCYFGTVTNGGLSAGKRVNTVTQCCPGYKVQLKFRTRFSFLIRDATCELE